MDQKIRVMLVDDHPLVRVGFLRLLESESDIEIVAEAETGREAFELFRQHLPDVVVLDLVMPTGFEQQSEDIQSQANGGLEALRRIRCFDDSARVLVLTGKEGGSFPSHVLQAGAQGFMTKRSAPEELGRAIREVYARRRYISAGVELPDVSQDPVKQLTRREFQVFSQLAEGVSVADIARAMNLSPKTVHAHRANIFRKLNVASNAEIVHMAIRNGIVEA